MTRNGAAVVITSAGIGLAVAGQHGLDGAQAFMVCAFTWIVVSSGYHAGAAVLGLVRRGRRR